MASADALARFLTALGVAGENLPVDLDDRATRYRTEVAGRRMLIVLDNATAVEQVRPLLPGSGTCTVVVTSRDNLAGLIALHGALRLDLDLLSPAEAVDLLRRLIGQRVDAEPDVAATLTDRCARLPLALRVAAELVASRPTVPLADLVVELTDQQRRLELLDVGGDPYAAVSAVFSWSIRHLPPDAARAFKFLGLHVGPDLDLYAAAALANASLDQAQQVLDVLTRAHLVHSTGAGRYGMHDLLRAYAAHLAATEHNERQRQAALSRLFDYFLATAAAALDSLYPAEAHRRPRIQQLANHSPNLTNPDDAKAWLDAERPCLVAMAAHTATHGWPTYTIRLSIILYRYLESGHYTDALAIHGHAHRAAELAGDRLGQAYALRGLGVVQVRMGRLGEATDQLQEALSLYREAGEKTGEAIALANLGLIHDRLGRYEASAEHHEQALSLFQQLNDQTGEAGSLGNLGIIYERLGRYEASAEHHEQALSLFQQLNDQTGEAGSLNNLGMVETQLGRYETAARHLRQALARFRKLGIPLGEAHVLDELGELYIRRGQAEQATEYIEQALTLYREIGDRIGEAETLNSLGEAAGSTDRPSDALLHHRDALSIAENAGARAQVARASVGLGNAHLSLGDLTRARSRYEHALALYTDLGRPEAEDIRSRLAVLTQSYGIWKSDLAI